MNLIWEHSRPVVTVAEVAAALGISENQVRALVDEGRFASAAINLRQGARQHLRIMRWSVEAWLANRLEDQGVPVPASESREVSWWRQQLRSHERVHA